MLHTLTSPEFVTATIFSADDNYDDDHDGDSDYFNDGYSFVKSTKGGSSSSLL